MTKINVTLTSGELFDLIQIIGNRIDHDQDLRPLYKKLLNKQPKINNAKKNLDYELPFFNPKVIKEVQQ